MGAGRVKAAVADAGPLIHLAEIGEEMAQVTVLYDRAGNTLTVSFGDPQDEYVCAETGDEVILM